MKLPLTIQFLLLLLSGCQPERKAWNGPTMTKDRAHLTVGELTDEEQLPLVDLSFLAKPSWATTAKHSLEGTLVIKGGVLTYPIEKEYYPGENVFPALQLDLVNADGLIVPPQPGKNQYEASALQLLGRDRRCGRDLARSRGRRMESGVFAAHQRLDQWLMNCKSWKNYVMLVYDHRWSSAYQPGGLGEAVVIVLFNSHEFIIYKLSTRAIVPGFTG